MLEPLKTIQIFQRQADPQAFVAGQVIFQEGQPGDLMYGVIEGEVEILVNQKPIELIQPGAVFGIGSLIGIEYRTYTAIAKTPCKLAYLDKQRFLFAVQETPLFALGVMRSYSDRLNRIGYQLGAY